MAPPVRAVAFLVLLLLVAPFVSASMKVEGVTARGGVFDRTVTVSEGGSFRSKGWGATDLVVDFDRGLVAGNLTLPNAARFQLVGALDPETYALDAKVRGGVWDEGGSGWHRKGAFTGTLVGELADNSDSADSLAFARERAAKGESVPVSIGWDGTLTLAWTEFVFREGESTTDPRPPQGAGGAPASADVVVYFTGSLTGGRAAETKATAFIAKIEGEVEVKKAAAADFVPAKVGDKLEEGDFVSTGFDSFVDLEFPYASVRVFKETQLRIDEFLRPGNVGKTTTFLQVGLVAAKVKHVAGIRSDFHVPTPGANAAIRNSAMVVGHDASTGVTTVYVTDDRAYVQGANDTAEREVAAGDKTRVEDGVAAAPVPFEPAEVAPELRPEAFGAPAEDAPPEGDDGTGSDGADEGGGIPAGGVVATLGVAAAAALARYGRGRGGSKGR